MSKDRWAEKQTWEFEQKKTQMSHFYRYKFYKQCCEAGRWRDGG